MRKTVSVLVLLILLIATSGCSAVMALKQPSKKNLQVLATGTDRENIIAYLGAPVSSEQTEEGRTEIYQFVQGYSGGVKATRATWHIVADVFTLFIWELVAMPAEAVFDGEEMTVKVLYDQNNKLSDFAYLKRG